MIFRKRHSWDKVLFLTLSLLTFVLIFSNNGVRYDGIILTIFYLIGLGALYSIFLSIDKKSYSLNKTTGLFYYFFFSLAPAIQFKFKASFFIKEYLSREVYLKAGLVLLGVLLVYLVGYHVATVKFKKGHDSIKKQPKKAAKELNLVVLYAISIGAVILYLYLIKFEWRVILFRPPENWMKENTNGGLIGYAVISVIRYVPFFVLLTYIYLNKNRTIHTVLLMVLFLVTCFPIALSRGILAAVYIPLLLAFIPFFRKGFNYTLLFMGGVLGVFPILNSFRNIKEGAFKFDFHLFNSGHFDAFQNFALLLDEQLITNGRQLLGSVLFFVQDTHWEGRPHGTGYLLGETLGYSYLNVAMPFFGEGYANFGYIGILLFLGGLIWCNAFLDAKHTMGFRNVPLKSFYSLMLGFEFYVLRGDLSSSIKKMTGFILAITVVTLGVLLFNKHRRLFIKI